MRKIAGRGRDPAPFNPGSKPTHTLFNTGDRILCAPLCGRDGWEICESEGY